MQNWEALLVNRQTTINETIKVIDKGGQRIALVIDEAYHLLGTVTDGDIRRALLNHVDLDSPVQKIMCHSPKTVNINWSTDLILSTIEKYKVTQLPIVDGEYKVVGLQTVYDFLGKSRYDNPVFLVAGGLGKRLHPLTQDCPKPLLKIGNKPILELILEHFIALGFHRFYISVHFMPHMIKQHFGNGSTWGVSIQYIQEAQPLGTAGALSLLPHDEIDLPVFMMNADLLTSLDFKNLLDFHYKYQGIATVGVRQYENCIPFGVIEFNGHNITSIVEKPVQRFFISAGIYVLSPEFIQKIAPSTAIDMPDLLQSYIHSGNKINMFPIHEYWLDIGQLDDFKKAQEEYLFFKKHVNTIC